MTRQSHTREWTAAPLLTAALVALGAAAPAAAQQSARAFISINGGLQALTGDFSQDVVFPESGGLYREVLSAAAAHEQSRFESSYRFRPGALFDVNGGVNVTRHFGLGIGISQFNMTDPVSISAQVPHPFFFDRDRSISGTSGPLTRSERAFHLQARAVVPATDSFTVTVFGGPTVFSVGQQLVTDVRFTHEYPFDTASFSSAELEREFGTAVGYNLGADLAYYFSANVGIGWLARYSRATVELATGGGDTLPIRAGGLHTAGGLRLRF